MILYETDDIRKRIQSVLAIKNARRFAIVAFVGQDALDFIESPAGLTVYCWPNVAATHPDGIESLISQGATVYFVDRLHIKLYWSENGGAVLGSCNLTQNALGSSGNGLYELAYFIKDSRQIDIVTLLHSFRNKRQKVTDDVLKAYRRKYNAAAARRDEYASRPQKKDATPLPSFGEYLKQQKRRWSITFWGTYAEKNPRGVVDAVSAYERNEGLSRDPNRYIADWVPCEHKPQVGEWVLTCKYGSDYGRLNWVYTHIVAKPRKNSPLWCATEVKKQTERPPFDCKEKRFIDACHAFLKDEDIESSFVMTDAKLSRLADYYRGKL